MKKQCSHALCDTSPHHITRCYLQNKGNILASHTDLGSSQFGSTHTVRKPICCTLWWLNKQALHHLRSQVESRMNQVCTGPYLQNGGGRRIIPQSFFLWQGFSFLEMTPYKAEHDYSVVLARITAHKTLTGRPCQQ